MQSNRIDCMGHVESTGEKREADRSFIEKFEKKQKTSTQRRRQY